MKWVPELGATAVTAASGPSVCSAPVAGSCTVTPPDRPALATLPEPLWRSTSSSGTVTWESTESV